MYTTTYIISRYYTHEKTGQCGTFQLTTDFSRKAYFFFANPGVYKLISVRKSLQRLFCQSLKNKGMKPKISRYDLKKPRGGGVCAWNVGAAAFIRFKILL